MRAMYFLSSDAENDIDDIVTYLAEENPKAALTFLDTLYETMEVVRVLSGYRDIINLIG